MGSVKAIGIAAALRITKIQSTREGVGPKGQPSKKIGRVFYDHRLSWRPCQNEAELAADKPRVENRRWRVAFADSIKVEIRHIEPARAVHGHAVGITKTRGAP